MRTKNDLHLICTCGSLEHQFYFWRDEKDIYAEVYLSERKFFSRLWYGLKYIFGYKCRYGAWEEFLFDDINLKQLKDWLDQTAKEQ